jgi:hypothetical protein
LEIPTLASLFSLLEPLPTVDDPTATTWSLRRVDPIADLFTLMSLTVESVREGSMSVHASQ